MQTTIKTLEDFLMEEMKQGSKILPLVLECFPFPMANHFHLFVTKKAAMQNTSLKAIAFKEYCYGIACGNIPVTMPFSEYYTEGDIPDQYGLSMLLCLMEQISVDKYDVAYLYLYYIIDNLVGPM